jgi:hypothetical protein
MNPLNAPAADESFAGEKKGFPHRGKNIFAKCADQEFSKLFGKKG